MKYQEHTALNGHHDSVWDQIVLDRHEALGDQHIASSVDTPMRLDAFDLTDEEKMKTIAKHFREIMLTLGLDLTDDSLRGTPARVAKMYVKEFFSGLNPANKPEVSLFDNKFGYHEPKLEQIFALLAEVSPKIAEHGTFNFCLSNGQALFTYAIDNSAGPMIQKMKDKKQNPIFVSEYLEETPLAQAEWIKFFGVIFRRISRILKKKNL